jgi:hypothetical protein
MIREKLIADDFQVGMSYAFATSNLQSGSNWTKSVEDGGRFDKITPCKR